MTATHEHGWLTESSHPTSEGRVVYVRCGRCGVRRVDLQPHPHLPPGPLTRVLGDDGSLRSSPLVGQVLREPGRSSAG